jgi:hypothetical protein
MDATRPEIVVRDSRPLQAVLLGIAALVFASWAVRTPIVGVPLLLVWAALVFTAYRWPRNSTVASANGIAGLRVRVPRSHRPSGFDRHEVIRSVTPWDQIECLSIGTWGSLSQIRVRLTDGREADLGASAVTRRGLRKIAGDLERLRPPTP